MNVTTKTNHPRPALTRLDLLSYQVLLEEGNSKTARAFRLLLCAKGGWVRMPAIGKTVQCRAVGSLMSSMRKFGCVIDNKIQRADGTHEGETTDCKSWYRLVKEPKEIAAEL